MDKDLNRMRRSLEKQLAAANRLTSADVAEARALFEKTTSSANRLREKAAASLEKLAELYALTDTLEKEIAQKKVPLQQNWELLDAQLMIVQQGTKAHLDAVNESMAARNKLDKLGTAETDLRLNRIHLHISGICMGVFAVVDEDFATLLNKKEYEQDKAEWLRRLYDIGPHIAAIGADLATLSPYPSIAAMVMDLTRDTRAEADRIEKEQVEWRDVVVWLLQHWEVANKAFEPMFEAMESQNAHRLNDTKKSLERVRAITAP